MGLAGEAGDEVAVDVGDTGMAQAGEVVQDNGAGVEAAADLRFAVNEGLDAEADAVDSDGLEGGEGVVGDLAGGALDGDFRVGMDLELMAHGLEEALEMLRGEEAGSAAAEEDGVDGRGKFEAKLLGPVGCGGEVVDEAIDVAGMVAGRRGWRYKARARCERVRPSLLLFHGFAGWVADGGTDLMQELE